MEMQIPAGPRYGSREKSGLVCQGEVRHECTKQALARLRPGGTGDPGRRYRRSRVARAEHLDLAEKPPGLILHRPAAMLRLVALRCDHDTKRRLATAVLTAGACSS